MELDPLFTPSVLIEKIKTNEYIKRFGLPNNETLVCAFKCTCKRSNSKLGKMYVFSHHICFWPQVGKANFDMWKFEEISGIISDSKVIKILLIKNEVIKVSGFENEKYIQIVIQHWTNYCISANRLIMTSDNEFDKFETEDSCDASSEVMDSNTDVPKLRQRPASISLSASNPNFLTPRSVGTPPVPITVKKAHSTDKLDKIVKTDKSEKSEKSEKQTNLRKRRNWKNLKKVHLVCFQVSKTIHNQKKTTKTTK